MVSESEWGDRYGDSDPRRKTRFGCRPVPADSLVMPTEWNDSDTEFVEPDSAWRQWFFDTLDALRRGEISARWTWGRNNSVQLATVSATIHAGNASDFYNDRCSRVDTRCLGDHPSPAVVISKRPAGQLTL